MFAFLGVALLTHRARAFLPVLQVSWSFVVATLALNAIWFAANAFHGDGLRQPVQQVVYLGVLLAVGTAVHRSLLDSPATVRVLRWSALVCALSLIGALTISMALNGVNAAAVFAQTIAAADPEVLQKELYRAAFAGFGFDEDVVSGNLRHEVFGALLVAMAVSAACTGVQPFASAGARGAYQVSMGLGTMLIVLSLSRSVMVALAVWPLLLLFRAGLAMRFSPRLVGGAVLGAAATVALGATGVLPVLWVRFTQETGSYEARDELYQLAFTNIRDHYLMGGVNTAGASSHNFVLDSWLRSGVFGVLAAAAVFVLLLGLFVSLVLTLPREPDWMLPVAVLLALTLVRLLTAGGGLVPPVSWVGLGVVAGFLAYRRDLLTLSIDEPVELAQADPAASR